MKRLGVGGVLLLLALPLFSSLARPGIHNFQDIMQFFRIYQVDRCLADWQIPCRWVPDMGFGFGYPLFLYYPPAPYYLGAFFHTLGFQYITAVNLLFVLGFLASGLSMFFFLAEIFPGRWSALAGSALYLYAPVRAVQVYVRGSLSEFLSFIFFPLLFLFSYRLVVNKSRQSVLYLSLALAGLLLTHNLTALTFFPILGLWILILLWQSKKWSAIIRLAGGLGLGLGLAAFFLIPIVFERNLVHLESLTGGYFDYRQHFVSLYQLFISNRFGYGSSQLGPGDDLSLSVGQIHWILALVAVILALRNYSRQRRLSQLVLILGAVELGLLFLAHQRSAFVWDRLPFLALWQFPWRFLVVGNFLLSTLSAAAIHFLPGSPAKTLALAAIGLVFLLHGSFFKPQVWRQVEDNQLLTGQELAKQQTASIGDYLPKAAAFPPNYPAPPQPEVISGQARIASYHKGSATQLGQIQVTSPRALIRAPIFDFAGLQVFTNGRPVSHSHDVCSGQDYCFGQVSFWLPRGDHQVKIQLSSTWPRLVGDAVSLLTLAAVSLVSVTRRRLI